MTKTAAYAIRVKSRRLISAFSFGTFAAVVVYSIYATAITPQLEHVPLALFWIALFLIAFRFRMTLRRLPAWIVVAVVALELGFVFKEAFWRLTASSSPMQYEALSAAVRANDLGSVKRILEHDSNPDFVAIPRRICPPGYTCYDESRHRPLDIAVASGYTDVAAYLVAHGAFLSRDDGDGLDAAAKRGDLPMVRFLIDHGVLVNARDGKSIALWNAVDSKQADIVSLLLDAGANPNSWQYSGVDLRAVSALALAQSTNSRQIVLLLRRAGAVE